MEALSGRLGEKSFWGYLGVGLVALAGGIVVFIFVVIPDRQLESGVPRQAQGMFTNLYMNQLNARNETGRFSAALNVLDITQDECRQFNCLLTLTPDAQDYTFKLSKDNRTWAIHSRSPVPKELGVPEAAKPLEQK